MYIYIYIHKYIYTHIYEISADPTGLGVSEFMVHPVPPNFSFDQTAHIFRFSDSEIRQIPHGFSERLRNTNRKC
jgi:hypothetical protein